MNGNTLIACVCKPYTIQLDGKPFKVEGERLVGFFLEPVGKVNPFEMKKGGFDFDKPFFKAAVFTEQKNGFEILSHFAFAIWKWVEIIIWIVKHVHISIQ